jgi:SAM-dependent methyltransferase
MAWSSGDYSVVGTTLQIVGEALCEALDLRSGQRVLDVAAGNGNASLAAARRWAEVVSTDYVPALLERGRERAKAERLNIEFRTADAEALPFADASFDIVLSTFGVMFTPNQEQAAREMLRVCRPGGKTGLANWTPEGFVGQLFKVIGQFMPPPAGVRSPALWGTEARLGELLGASASVQVVRREFTFRYRSASTSSTSSALLRAPPQGLPGTADGGSDRAGVRPGRIDSKVQPWGSDSLVIPSEYLEVVAMKHRS